MAGQLHDRTLSLSSSIHPLGAEAVITVGGELDAATGPELTAVMTEAVAAGTRRLIVDVSAVGFLDAAGLHALRGGPSGWGAGVEVVLRAPSRPVRRLLELTDHCGLVEGAAPPPANRGDRR